MLKRLEKLIGSDALLRVCMINERRGRFFKNIRLKDFIYLISNPIKIVLITFAALNKIPKYTILFVMIFEWIISITNYFFYKYLDDIFQKKELVSKERRLTCFTNYYLLVSLFERPILDKFYMIFYCIFIFSIILMGKWFQAALLITIWISIWDKQETIKAYLIIYLKEFIKEDENVWN